MRKRVLFLSFFLSLAMAAALLWLLSPRQNSVGAAMPYPPTPTPTPVPRYVAVTGADAGNDCAAASAPCRTVQRAVDAARAGSVIKVAQGTYSDIHQRDTVSQVVYLDKSVTLQGGYTTASGFAEPPLPEAHPTILDAQGRGRVMVIEGAGPTVDGFTITGGAGYYSGGGIMVEGDTGVILRHNRIVGNSAEGDGGAIFINGGAAQILDNYIADNTSTWSAGLRIINDADVAVVGNEIRGNVAGLRVGGIGIDCCGGSTPLIAQNLIVDNDGGGGGGGIVVMSTNARLVNNVVALNQADCGDGILLTGSASFPVSVTLAHNTLVGQATGDEGVRAEPYAAATLVNNIVATYTTGITNTAPTSATVTADHTLFDGNGTDYGPGVSSTNSITGLPAFVSPGIDDYHISAASAAIDAGADAGVGDDFDDDPRLGVPDVGADEYWAPGALKRVYLPLISIPPYPAQPPQIEPQPGEYFPCDAEDDGPHCTDGVSDRRLVDVSIAYDIYGEGAYWPPRSCALQDGDPVIIVSGTIENVSDEEYWTMVSGAAYDSSGNFLGRNVDITYIGVPSPVPVFLPAHGTSGFILHLKSSRAIALIRIDAEGASPWPPP